MRYLSLCSGIEAASVAWETLGWKPAAFAEIDPFASAVLSHHYPGVQNLGDITQFEDWPDLGTIDLVCAGTPCQSFSIAGFRQGLADPRGNLALVFLAILHKYRPKRFVWENVPGVLSTNGGRDFGALLSGMASLGYGWAYRVLDAQYTRVAGFDGGVPQRRNRVYVVGYLGDWRYSAATLFEPEGLRGHLAPIRSAWAADASCFEVSTSGSFETGVSPTLDTRCANGPRTSQNALAIVDKANAPIAFAENSRGELRIYNGDGAIAPPVMTRSGKPGQGRPCIVQGRQVRKLTPLECERLQGFPDNYTLVPYRGKPAHECPDTPRYHALGNAWAVNVPRWIGARIELTESVLASLTP